MEWPELQRLFDLVCDLPAAQHDSLLNRECRDPEMRRQVEELLAESEAGAAEFLTAIVIRDSIELAAPALNGRAGERLGSYVIERELGRGGMGDVFLARRDDREFDMLVAVKIVRRGLDLREVLLRFRQERQILARLEHPNIARLLDGGSTKDGLPYLVMEYVEGQPITNYCDSRHLGIEDRCRLMLAVCDAVRHAHRHLVVHRDIKPSNILVDEGGVPKLLDFGIAKLLDTGPDKGSQTATLSHRPMTPDYASPEQIQGAAITTATDVYLLGAVLFQLLTACKPRRGEDGTALPKPSQAKPEWGRGLRGDLDNIVLRATHREPGQRYGSAQELADDLRRFLEHRPVLARPDTLRYRVRKWVRRSPLTAAALLLAILSVTAGVAGTLYQARRAERRFQQVRNLAHAFVFDVYDQIATMPGATRARQTIVATALTYLENLSREAAGDPGVTRELAEAYLKIGTVQGDPVGSNLGDPAGAMQSYRRAESLLTGLRSRGDPATGKLLMRLYDRISVLQRSQSDPTGAVASTRRAREYARQVLARQPDDAETLTAAVEYDVSLSRALRAARDFPGAEQAAQSAIVSAEKLAAGPSGGAEARSNLADAISNLGVLQALRGDLDAAAASYRRLVEIRERMAVADPRNVVFQRQLMIAYGHVGDVLGFREGQHLGDFAGAAAVLEKAVTIAEWLTQQDPQDEKARFDLASAKLRLGAVLINLHQPANGRRQIEEAAALNAPLLRKSPANVLFQANSINLDQSLALAFAGEGRADAAVRLARQALAEAQAGIVPKITLPSQVVYADMTLAEVLARTGRLAEARKFAANVGAPLDAQPLLFRGGWLRAYFYSSLADVYRKTGDVRLAGEDLRRARDVWSGISGGPALSAFRQRELQRLDRELAGLK